MGFLSGLLGLDAGKATKKAAEQNKGIITGLQTTGNNIINTGEQKSEGAINRAISGYDPYTAAGSAATSMYSDALGLNGTDGNAAATSAFQAGPGYDFALKQGEQSALRGASAAGMLNSGNTLAALTEYGQGTANKEYGSWLDRLAGQSAQGLSAVNGQGGFLGGLANLYQSTAGDRLGLEGTVAQGLMGANNQVAQGKEAGSAGLAGLGGALLGGGIKLATGGLF